MPVEPGRTLFHDRLIDKIGEGGMGVVVTGRALAATGFGPVEWSLARTEQVLTVRPP